MRDDDGRIWTGGALAGLLAGTALVRQGSSGVVRRGRASSPGKLILEVYLDTDGFLQSVGHALDAELAQNPYGKQASWQDASGVVRRVIALSSMDDQDRFDDRILAWSGKTDGVASYDLLPWPRRG